MSDAREATEPHDHDAVLSAPPLEALINGALVRYTGATAAIHARLTALLRAFVVDAAEAKQTLDGVERPVDLDIHLEPRTAEGQWRILVNGKFFTMAYDSAYLLPYLEWLAISRAIELARDSVAFHAASLTREGRTAILIAKSGSGKTTLTVGLAGRGWLPFSDDLTIVDLATQTISPFQRCFHADAYTRAVIAEAIPISAPDPELPDYVLPANWASPGCAPTAIVIVYRDAESPTTIRPITRAEAAGALFTAAIRNGVPRSRVARLAADFASTVNGCWEVNNSDLAETLSLIELTITDRPR